MQNGRQWVQALLAEGKTVAEIARATGLATNTVRYHRDRLREAPPPVEPSAEVPHERDSARRQVDTRQRVAELLALGVSRAEAARRLRLSKATVSYHARRLGHDVDERCARRYDWVAVQRFYDAGHSLAECMEAFGFSKQTWHSAVNAARVIPRPAATPITDLCVAGIARSRGNLKRRLLREGLKDERCEGCGLHRWQNLPLPLALHHVNGDRDDNRLENLQLLCPNCHALTDNFSGRNRPRLEAA
ncbi:MAG TPA: LuxR C-terminal-related transcriptional regulator [Solirubrobacteraceae bacterium]